MWLENWELRRVAIPEVRQKQRTDLIRGGDEMGETFKL